MSELPWRRLTLAVFHRRRTETGSAFIEHVHSSVPNRHFDVCFLALGPAHFSAAKILSVLVITLVLSKKKKKMVKASYFKIHHAFTGLHDIAVPS